MISVSIQSVSKKFLKEKQMVTALHPISFEVAKGELFGIIGPDGSGKTTLFRILNTLLLPDSGDAWVDGFHIVHEYKQIRKRTGYMPGKFSLYQDLTVQENLQFFATIFNTSIEKNYDLIKEIYGQIEPFKNRKAGKLSGGMKQKLALSCALIHKPTVLFLDEPTTGVDAVSRKEFWQILKSLQKQGITILVSTPYMDEANLCDRVALIQEGKVLSMDTPEIITGNFHKNIFAIKSAKRITLLSDLRSREFTEHVYPFGEYFHLITKSPMEPRQVYAELASMNHQNLKVEKVKADIEDVFIDLMRNEHAV